MKSNLDKTLENITIKMGERSLSPYKRFFSRRGTKILFIRKTGISRSTLWYFLEMGRTSRGTLSAIDKFIEELDPILNTK